MKLILSIILIFSGLSFLNPVEAVSQDRKVKAKVKQEKARVVQRLRHKGRAVTVIKPAKIFKSASLSLNAVSPRKTNAFKIKGNVPKPLPPSAGSIKANPPGKLKVTLTAQRPYSKYRAYLSYNYPQQVYMNDNSNYIVFSPGNIPGMLSYSAKLKKGKKYLVEILADPWGTSGGKIQHNIGDEKTVHEFGKFNVKINVSRIIMPSEDGWVGGSLMQDHPSPGQWRVYSVSITEMD